MIWIILIIICCIVVYAMIQSLRKSPLYDVAKVVGTYIQENEELEQQKRLNIEKQNQIIEELRQSDANFSYSAFQNLVKNTSSWAIEVKSTKHDKVMQQLRKYASASFLNDYVFELAKTSQVNECAYRNVRLEEMIIKEHQKHNDYDVIIVEALVCYDYATYQRQKLMRQKEMKSRLMLTYTKKKETIGINQTYEAMTHCKNCGAAIDVIHDEKCPYCDSYYYEKSNMWMLHELTEYQCESYGLS